MDAFASNVDVETDYRIRYCYVSRDVGKARKMVLGYVRLLGEKNQIKVLLCEE